MSIREKFNIYPLRQAGCFADQKENVGPTRFHVATGPWIMLVLLGLLASCGISNQELVGHWKGTYHCQFPPESSIKIADRPFPVEFTFLENGMSIRTERMNDGTLKVDSTPYAVEGGMLIWDHGNEASDELNTTWNGDIELIFEYAGGKCVTRLSKAAR